MSKRSWLAFAAGAAGALILGYCIYYDRKRRTDPNYRKRVHERRLKEQPVAYWTHNNECRAESERIEMNDDELVLRHFQNQIKLGDELFKQGKLDDGLVYLANAIMLCAQPVALMQTMKLALPDQIYNMLLTKLPELQKHVALSNPNLELDLD